MITLWKEKLWGICTSHYCFLAVHLVIIIFEGYWRGAIHVSKRANTGIREKRIHLTRCAPLNVVEIMNLDLLPT